MRSDNEATEALLLVDDNPTNLQVLFQTLKDSGCRLLVAKDGHTALAIARKSRPDLILLDIMMPDIDGHEVCRRLKAEAVTAGIPVIFLSALGETEDKVRGLELGAVDYIAKPFQPEEVIARVNTHLTIHRLKREVDKQKNQLEKELEIVSEVQRRLLPKQLPQVKGLKLDVCYETSRYAGGDYYDIAAIDDNQWGFLVADAEGHSAPAAVLMAMTCALFRAYPGTPDKPDEVLTYLNRHLCKVAEPSFITALYAVYDCRGRSVRVARAGHPPPMIYRLADQAAAELDCPGIFPMGIQDFPQVPVTQTQLQPGDRLLLYTDGITERFNPRSELYGEQRLLRQLAVDSGNDPQAVKAAILEDLKKFAGPRPADDDQMLLLGIVT